MRGRLTNEKKKYWPLDGYYLAYSRMDAYLLYFSRLLDAPCPLLGGRGLGSYRKRRYIGDEKSRDKGDNKR